MQAELKKRFWKWQTESYLSYSKRRRTLFNESSTVTQISVLDKSSPKEQQNSESHALTPNNVSAVWKPWDGSRRWVVVFCIAQLMLCTDYTSEPGCWRVCLSWTLRPLNSLCKKSASSHTRLQHIQISPQTPEFTVLLENYVICFGTTPPHFTFQHWTLSAI